MPAHRTKSASKEPSLGEAMKELEEIVARLEDDSTSIEESVRLYERGAVLSRLCLDSLTQIERRIAVITENARGEMAAEDYEPADEDAQ